MKKNLIAAFLVLSSIFLFSGTGHLLGDMPKEELRLYMGANLTISVNNPTRIAIGNPQIADVVQVSKIDMTIAPKSAGTTTLVYWDNFGEQSYTLKVFSEDTIGIKSRVDRALERLDITQVKSRADDEEGKVFLVGKFANSAERERLILGLGPLQQKVVDLTTIKDDETVIEIDVQVLELNKGNTEKLGFIWPSQVNITESAAAGITGTSWGKLFKIGTVAREAYTMTLDALVKEGNARVLSRPRLSCLSGKEAKLLVGGEVPILSSSVTGGGTSGTTATPGSVEYKEYGIKLNIKPTVKDEGKIHLNLGVEVSEVGEAVTTSYALAYPFTKRTANTELYLDDGQTMAIGGLIKQKTEQELTKFPWLADVPVLGTFFRHRTIEKGGGSDAQDDSELFITLTPRIVSEPVATDPGSNKKNIMAAAASRSVFDKENPNPKEKYSFIVQKRITDNLSYPQAARNSGFQGTVKLALRLSYNGELMDVKVKQSSGYKILDDNAQRTARSIRFYPPFPPGIESRDLWIEVPISYLLE